MEKKIFLCTIIIMYRFSSLKNVKVILFKKRSKHAINNNMYVLSKVCININTLKFDTNFPFTCFHTSKIQDMKLLPRSLGVFV